MFTLIRNYRAMFMLMIANKLEGNLASFDADQDSDISSSEVQALLEQSPEAREAVDLAEVETLEAAAELADNIDFSDGLSSIEQKTIQYLATKILKLNGQNIEDGSIDGNIGRGSRADLALATGMDIASNEDVNAEVLTGLVEKAQALVVSKRAEFAEAAAEAVEAVDNAKELLAGYENVEAIRGLDEDGRKTAQEALRTLGYYTMAIDGDFGRGSEAAYNAYLEQVAIDNRTPEEVEAIETQEHALAALEAIKTDRNAVKALQQALIDAGEDLGSYGADGSAGQLTRAAVESNPEVALSALADYIDTTDDENVTERLAAEKPADGDAIDAALTEYFA